MLGLEALQLLFGLSVDSVDRPLRCALSFCRLRLNLLLELSNFVCTLLLSVFCCFHFLLKRLILGGELLFGLLKLLGLLG